MSASLDPKDWDGFRKEAHAFLDTCIDHMQGRVSGNEPVWKPVSEEAHRVFERDVPRSGAPLPEVLNDLQSAVMAHPTGNLHPRFFGWVHGAGSAAGLLAEMAAAAMNANCGGRDHAAIYAERQVIRWCRDIFGFPAGAGGLITQGTSMATVLAVGAARVAALGTGVRGEGAKPAPQLTGYCSVRAHTCVKKAFELAGIGGDYLRTVPVDDRFAMDLGALREAIARDRADGYRPLFVVGSAGTVDTGSFDDLAGVADIAAEEDMWFHVDGAFGAWAKIAGESLAERVNGIERANSLACDFHKWISVPYDAGVLLMHKESTLPDAFSARPDYLARGGKALGGGDPWPCEYGIDLSRGFRALKVWVQFVHYGVERLGAAIAGNCAVAAHLGKQVESRDGVSLAAPVQSNIVCIFVEGADDARHRDITAELQADGVAAPSTTVIGGRTCLRIAIVNHRTTERDADILLDGILERAGG